MRRRGRTLSLRLWLILVVMAIIGISGVVEVVLTAVLYHTGGLAGAHAWGQMGKTSSSERWILLWPVAGVLTITLTLALVAWLIRGPVLRPLAAVSEAVEGIAGGDLTGHLPSSPVREIAEVTAALEGMSGALRDALARQSALEEERRLFVGAIVHDLRTPLFTLHAYLRGLRAGIAATPEKVREYVDECITKADALERLVSDLFAFTRLEYLEQEPDRVPLELGALLRQMIEGARPLAEAKGIALIPDGTGETCGLLGDSHLLTRASWTTRCPTRHRGPDLGALASRGPDPPLRGGGQRPGYRRPRPAAPVHSTLPG